MNRIDPLSVCLAMMVCKDTWFQLFRHEQATNKSTTDDAVVNNNKKFKPLNELETYNSHTHPVLEEKKNKNFISKPTEKKICEKKLLHFCTYIDVHTHKALFFFYDIQQVDDGGDDDGDT